MSEDSPVSRTTSLADSQSKHSDVLQSNASPRGDRASVTLYALVAVGLLAVSLVAVFVISGGVLGGDSPADDVDDSEPAGDTDPTPVNDSSDDNDSSETVETPGEGDSNENTTDSGDGTDDSPTDDSPTNDDENTNSTDSDDSRESEDGPSPTDKEEVYVDVRIYDLGFPEKGEMRLRKAGSEEVVETHNFSEDGQNREFRYLDPSQQYELTIDTPYYPEETVGFRADLKDTMDVTVGYEFNSTDSYVIDWELGHLPQYFDGDHTSERAEEEAIPLTGVTRTDRVGNNYMAWDDAKIPGITQYYYSESTNKSFRNGESPSAEWEETSQYWGELKTTDSKVIEKGLSGVEQRRFVRTKESGGFVDEVHVYEVNSTVFGDPILVKINPNTGYPTEMKIQVEKMTGANMIYSSSKYETVEEKISVMPADFPVEKFNLKR